MEGTKSGMNTAAVRSQDQIRACGSKVYYSALSGEKLTITATTLDG